MRSCLPRSIGVNPIFSSSAIRSLLKSPIILTPAPKTCQATADRTIERRRSDVACAQEFSVRPHSDHFSGDLMVQHQTRLRRRAAANHMLVGSADVGGDDLENVGMFDLPPMRVLELGVGDIL